MPQALGAKAHALVSFLTDVRGMEAAAAPLAGVTTYHDSRWCLRELAVKRPPRKLLGTLPGVVAQERADAGPGSAVSATATLTEQYSSGNGVLSPRAADA